MKKKTKKNIRKWLPWVLFVIGLIYGVLAFNNYYLDFYDLLIRLGSVPNCFYSASFDSLGMGVIFLGIGFLIKWIWRIR